jgi:hypothetical protein
MLLGSFFYNLKKVEAAVLHSEKWEFSALVCDVGYIFQRVLDIKSQDLINPAGTFVLRGS